MSGVNNYIIKQLRRQGCKISGSYLCPYVTSEYAKQAFAKERIVNPKYIDNNNPNIKPGTGMIEKALEELKLKENYRIFVIGDRFSDMKVAINVGGIGILVESPKTIELGDLEKAAGINTIHLAKNFLNAAEFIKKQVERN